MGIKKQKKKRTKGKGSTKVNSKDPLLKVKEIVKLYKLASPDKPLWPKGDSITTVDSFVVSEVMAKQTKYQNRSRTAMTLVGMNAKAKKDDKLKMDAAILDALNRGYANNVALCSREISRRKMEQEIR